MTVAIDPKFHDLFSRPILCALTTINPDGQPHTVPVWCDFDGERVRVNSPASTKKAHNLERDPKLTVFLLDPQNGGHWIEVQGYVLEMHGETDGARDHINKLSEKYTGNPVYKDWGAPRGGRRMYIIEATKVNGG